MMNFEGDQDGELDRARRCVQFSWIRNNVPGATEVNAPGGYDFIQNITNEHWEVIGRYISNNTHLEKLNMYDGALNDEKMSYLFRGLTSSSSIQGLTLYNNELSAAAMRSMVPFLHNANNLQKLDLDTNNIQSDGFNILIRALRDSPIEKLDCSDCGIESIEINTDQFPRHLETLGLNDNNINADGCRGIAKLLQGGDSTLEDLSLCNCGIDNEGVAILADALRNNTSLKYLGLIQNDGITKEGLVMLLKLVNDISSINATLESNHSLSEFFLFDGYSTSGASEDIIQIDQLINMFTNVNNIGDPEEAGREKVIWTQLFSSRRAVLAELQGVHHSLYSEINPLHLPEVLSLVAHEFGLGELYISLKSSVAGVISVVDRRKCIIQQLAYHKAKIAEHTAKSAELGTELAELDASDDTMRDGNEACRKKRQRIL